jgi:hypothetical protein
MRPYGSQVGFTYTHIHRLSTPRHPTLPHPTIDLLNIRNQGSCVRSLPNLRWPRTLGSPPVGALGQVLSRWKGIVTSPMTTEELGALADRIARVDVSIARVYFRAVISISPLPCGCGACQGSRTHPSLWVRGRADSSRAWCPLRRGSTRTAPLAAPWSRSLSSLTSSVEAAADFSLRGHGNVSGRRLPGAGHQLKRCAETLPLLHTVLCSTQ